MEISELRLPEPSEILPGVRKTVLAPGQDGIDRIEFFDAVVVFKVNGQVRAVVWVPVRGTVMIRDLNASF